MAEKVFISQPMTVKSETEILAEREKIWLDWLDQDHYGHEYELIDSYTKPAGKSRLWMLGDSIQKMEDADIIIFSDGWDSAKGCVVEAIVAMKYNILSYEYSNGKFVDIYWQHNLYIKEGTK